jgi:hypothetical protein
MCATSPAKSRRPAMRCVSRPVFAGTVNVSTGTRGAEQSETEWAGRLETLYPDGRKP